MKHLIDFLDTARPLIEQLKHDEGFRQHVYLDTEGIRTIGYGTNIDQGLDKTEAEFLLVYRTYQVAKELAEAKPVIRTVSDNRYYALCNMAYNLGVAGLLKFKNMWASIEADDWTGAADHAMDSKWARQVGVRAIRVTSLLRDG